MSTARHFALAALAALLVTSAVAYAQAPSVTGTYATQWGSNGTQLVLRDLGGGRVVGTYQPGSRGDSNYFGAVGWRLPPDLRAGRAFLHRGVGNRGLRDQRRELDRPAVVAANSGGPKARTARVSYDAGGWEPAIRDGRAGERDIGRYGESS